MSRVKNGIISVVLIMALVCTLCTARPTPAYANSSGTTIAIVLGGVIGGLMVLALIITLIVRNNPAWMPALPQGGGARRAEAWDHPSGRFRFGWQCRARDGSVPLVCW